MKEKVLNKNKLTNQFIANFQSTFSGIFTEEEIRKKINKNLKRIVLVSELDGISDGDYSYNSKQIRITPRGNNQRCLFHEFIHVIRGNETILGLTDQFDGIIEGFTALSEMIYMISKEKPNSKYKDSFKYIFAKNVTNYNNYCSLACLVQQLELLYEKINNEETLLEQYLKGKNIYIEINKIYDLFLSIISDENEDVSLDSMRMTYNLFVNMADLINVNDNLEISKQKMIEIEKEFKEIFLTFNLDYDQNKVRIFNSLSQTEHITYSKEKILLKTIFGKTENPTYNQKIKQLNFSFVKRENEV